MPILVLLFIIVPIAELYVIFKVGELIGILPTIAILIADALLGSMLLRRQGRAAWRRFNAAINEGRFPGREAADGVMIAVGGTLLLTPGFITDVFGLLFLIPPTRALIRRGLFRVIGRRFVLVGGAADAYGRARRRRGRSPSPGPAPGPGPGGQPYDLEGDAREMPSNGVGEEARDGPESPHLPPP
jgi:UPF0716 protein FxsA